MISELARHYLNAHPRDVVRILESSKDDDSSAFLSALSTAEQARVIANLLPQTATHFLSSVDVKDAASILEKVHTGSAAALLAALSAPLRRDILENLSLQKREGVSHLLRFPDDSVGAAMQVRSLACRDSATVRSAKQIVRRYAESEMPVMVVLDNKMQAVGMIAVSVLLASRERDLVKDRMRNVTTRLRARAAIHTIIGDEVWNIEEFLPVIEADGRFVGILSRATALHRAIANRGTRRAVNPINDTIMALAELAWKPGIEMLTRAATAPNDSEIKSQGGPSNE